MLDLTELRKRNVERCSKSFHKIEDWSPTDWACALAGEIGEACNLVKKLRRLTGPTKKSGKVNTPEPQVIIERIGKELADAMIYMDLLAVRLGIDLDVAVIDKFNEVSERVGSDIFLKVPIRICPRCKRTKPISRFSGYAICSECREGVEQLANG